MKCRHKFYVGLFNGFILSLPLYAGILSILIHNWLPFLLILAFVALVVISNVINLRRIFRSVEKLNHARNH